MDGDFTQNKGVFEESFIEILCSQVFHSSCSDVVSAIALVMMAYLLFLFLSLGTGLVGSVSFQEDVTITYKQKLVVDKLKQRVLPYIVESFMQEDIYIVKFLRSTNFDIIQAEKKFLQNIKWRNDTGMATIELEDFADMLNDYPVSITGHDKDGRPVMIAFTGDWNIRSAVVTGKIKRLLHYMDACIEVTARKIRKLQMQGQNVTQFIYILDLGQWNVVTHGCVQCLVATLDFLNSYENHFPGSAHKIYFVNTTPVIQLVAPLVRENVSKETRNAFQVFGTNKEHWEKVLLQDVDKDYLPEAMGGTMHKF